MLTWADLCNSSFCTYIQMSYRRKIKVRPFWETGFRAQNLWVWIKRRENSYSCLEGWFPSLIYKPSMPVFSLLFIKDIINTRIQFSPVCMKTTSPACGIATEQPNSPILCVAITAFSSFDTFTWRFNIEISHQMSSKIGSTCLLHMQKYNYIFLKVDSSSFVQIILRERVLWKHFPFVSLNVRNSNNTLYWWSGHWKPVISAVFFSAVINQEDKTKKDEN